MFQLEITMGNQAMYTLEDVAVALRVLADRLADKGETPQVGGIRDGNGNLVGNWKYRPVKEG